jgi:hypothetical protein
MIELLGEGKNHLGGARRSSGDGAQPTGAPAASEPSR